MLNNIPLEGGDFKARWIRTAVDYLDHPVLDRGPYDRRSAWHWLIINAAWKEKRANHKGAIITIARGQVLIGRSHLAKVWGWSEQMVRTFLNQLLAESMLEINQSNGHYANVATICNYEKYQTAPPERIRSTNQSLTSGQPVSNQTLTKDTNIPIVEDTPLPPKGAVPIEAAMPKFGKFEALEAFTAFNEVALRCGLPQAAKLTPNRERSIVARLKDYGIDGWHRALANIEKSKFLTGGTDQGFRADLDFVCQAKSFGKLHDGGYGNGRHTAAAPKSTISTFSHPPKRSPDAEYEATMALARQMGIIDYVNG